MGQRANYVIVDPSSDGGYALYYSHWAANRVPFDFFWGPDHALDFVRAQRRVDSKEWLDTTWAEGGALLDPERRLLLLFGGEDIQLEVPLRRVWLRLVAPMWPGWTVRWADRELVELADLVGVAEEQVLAADEPEGGLELSRDGDPWYDTAVTVRFEDGGVDAWGSSSSVEDVLAMGGDLVERVRELRSEAARIPSEPTDGPRGGVHLDLKGGRISAWSADGGAAIDWLLRQRWGPWDREFLGDRYERQIELADDCFSFPVPPDGELLDRLVTSLSSRSRVDGVQALKASLAAHGDGGEIAVNPWALRDDHVAPDEGTRDARLAAAVAAFGA